MKFSGGVLLIACCLVLANSALLPRKLGEIPLKFSAFLQVFSEERDADAAFDPDAFTLLISTFDAYALFQRDEKYYIRGPGKYLNNLTAMAEALTVLDKTAFWPNDPDFVPSKVFGYEAVAWPSGFLVPGKTAGQMEIYNFKDFQQPPVNIASKDEVDWFYHRTVWEDINNDGKIDAFTARFRNPSVDNPTRSELVWFENPGNTTVQSGWTQHILVTDGPDVHFRYTLITNANGQKFSCILASEFWNKRLMLYCVEDAPGAWTTVSSIIEIPVDLEAGQTFDCLIGDLNNDGVQDLLTTAYNTDVEEGYVFVYEIPETFPYGNFTKHMIADGFYANTIIAGDSMSPGSAKMFHRHVSEKSSKASLMLSGDDDGKHYILTPESEDKNNWSYAKSVLVDTMKTTSGKFAVEDLDGDGWTDIIAAGYTSGTLYVFTFAPESNGN